jgi:hypothetical protein
MVVTDGGDGWSFVVRSIVLYVTVLHRILACSCFGGGD